MAIFRQVHTSFWNDVKVQEDFTPEDKYFFLYLLTNPQTKQIGVYQITKKQMAFETGYSHETIKALMQRFEDYHKLIKYDNETRELVIFNWGKYNLKKAGKPVEDLIEKELKDVKNISLLIPICKHIEQKSMKKLIETFIDDSYNDTLTDRGKSRGQEEEKEKPLVENLAIDFYMKNFGHISPFMGEEINQWIDDLNQSLVVEAMKITLENNKRNWSYTKGILKDWHQQGFKRIQDVEAAQAEFRRQQQSKKRTGKGYAKQTEAVPEWLHQREELEPIQQPQQVRSDDLEDNQKRLDEILSKYKNTKGE
ncbi:MULTISPECIES: DnaD domain-containing protein [Bacillus]|uniref:DnaD domain-containing protein n=1 Tax=Bacillus TaxID=1386 RepID=UPI00046873DB|nr:MULTISPECIES: DnaD domain protein [Bacillus]MED1412837.1 DnaD domain protein [Bacillus paramycoides]MED1463849.1 DnaD domain protein [Bacillus paramycoides]MED1495558.1 DnaD domain protein [Bacillus paramycoides]